jgi:hypothetical protein
MARLRFLHHDSAILPSNFFHAHRLNRTRVERNEGDRGDFTMQDWISDWKKWSRAERCFAVVLVIVALMIPLGVLFRGGISGT